MGKILKIPMAMRTDLDKIFGSVLINESDRLIAAQSETGKNDVRDKINLVKFARPRFFATFQYNIFNDTHAILYEIMSTLNIKAFNKNQLSSILDNNRDLILDSPYVDTEKYSMTANNNVASEDDIFRAIKADVLDQFEHLSKLICENDEFESACVSYIDWYRKEYMAQICQDMSIITGEMGLTVKFPGRRSRLYKGIDDAVSYYNDGMKVIRSFDNESRIQSSIIDDKWLQDELQNEDKEDSKSMFNIGIKEMDATIGELRRGNMLGIMGPPKGGKTRFTNYLVQRALRLGYNVCVWPLEGEKDEWIAMQISAFLAMTSYEEVKKGRKSNIVRIDSKDILQKKYLNSPDIRTSVAVAKQTMATSERFGRLSFIEGTAYVEDMFEILKGHYESENQFDVLVIDQLVNVMSKTGKGKVERISEAYMMTKDFIANKLRVPALGLMPAQLKQEVVDYMRAHPDETLDVTSGGESAETSRTPDEVIGLFSSKEERDSNMMRFYSVASRHNESFKDFTARCYLGSCMFMSMEDEPEQ